MKKLKRILRGCPYLAALLITWAFITAGGAALLLYRGYGKLEPDKLIKTPLFALVLEQETHGASGSEISETGGFAEINPPEGEGKNEAGQESGGMSGDNKISSVIQNGDESGKGGRTAETSGASEKAGALSGQAAGQTRFITYTPVETDSIYYSDAGKVALTTDYPYTTVGEDYFDDAVFFGDSRTLGISDYAGLNSDFFCENGMTIYKLLDKEGVMCQADGEKYDLNQVLQQKKYGKIYIMLGMNELGYGNTGFFLEHYRKLLEKLREWQPQAIFFLQGNLHVSLEKDNPETEFNNININDKNAAIATLADGKDVFYLDINPLFTDEEGYLDAELTFDGVHLYADGYMQWKQFLMEHGVLKER